MELRSSWEMSTIGHPLSDLSILLSPFCFAGNAPSSVLQPITNSAYTPATLAPGLPSRRDCVTWYAEAAGWDPLEELDWGDAFATFRNAVIMQGIAARHAKRQASSERAKEIGDLMRPYGEFCFTLTENVKW